MSRVQLALNVDDLAASVAFYTRLLGTPPAKTRPGYANFAVTEPPLKLVLLENPGQGGTLNHLGIEVDSQVVAVSTWMRRPFAERPEAVAVQLRGMATDPVRQGAGLGARLLEAGLDRARSDGADLVWARARSTALAFYLANGFGRVGDEFVDTTTGLPHVVVLHTFG